MSDAVVFDSNAASRIIEVVKIVESRDLGEGPGPKILPAQGPPGGEMRR